MITNTAPASVLGAFSLNILQTFSDNTFVFKAGFKRYFNLLSQCFQINQGSECLFSSDFSQPNMILTALFELFYLLAPSQHVHRRCTLSDFHLVSESRCASLIITRVCFWGLQGWIRVQTDGERDSKQSFYLFSVNVSMCLTRAVSVCVLWFLSW